MAAQHDPRGAQTRERRRAAGLATALALALVLGAVPGERAARAATLGLPPPGAAPVLGLGDPDLIDLNQPDGYSVQFSGSLAPGFSGAPGDLVNVTGSFSISPPALETGPPLGGLLVFTSIRLAGPVGCGGGGLPAPAPFAFVAGSFTGVDALLVVSDPAGPGTVCDEEGDTFLAARFDGQPQGSAFGFQLEATSSLALPGDLQFQILNDAYAIVPEPSAALLVLGGLSLLARRRRSAPVR